MYPYSPLLFEDISILLTHFKKTTKASAFSLMLATIKNNMCRKFHTDVNDLRLLCTYSGRGTLWAPDVAIEKDQQDVSINKAYIQEVKTGDFCILKGALYPNAEPILHKSPAIEKDNEIRLLLRIDTNTFLGFE